MATANSAHRALMDRENMESPHSYGERFAQTITMIQDAPIKALGGGAASPRSRLDRPLKRRICRRSHWRRLNNLKLVRCEQDRAYFSASAQGSDLPAVQSHRDTARIAHPHPRRVGSHQ